MTDATINGDMGVASAAHADAMEWAGSPGQGVLRKRLHLVGGAESGQVTSIVRYEPGSTFPPHGHPGGEEILVLDGTFSDEHGDWPSGTYLLHPQGFRHAPFSRDGCTLFVKLRQYPGARPMLRVETDAAHWQPTQAPGVACIQLDAQAEWPESMRLERWAPGAEIGVRSHAGGLEYFVLEGAFADESGFYRRHSWLRIPPGGGHTPTSAAGCTLYIKQGGVGILRNAGQFAEAR